MSRTKRLFLVVVAIFAILLGYASYDIGKRTTFPGSKPQLKERLKKAYLQEDSVSVDSLSGRGPKN